MKRKLWIILALAVLSSVLCCGAALAEYAFTSFERESPVIFPEADGVYRGEVSWEVNFVPTAIKIYRLAGVAYTTSELVQDLPVTATSTILEAGYRYNLFIYYGDPDLATERVYQQFTIAQGNPSISVTQTVFPSIVNPNEKAAFTWVTNFTPTRIEIRNADTGALITTLPGTATGWDQFDRSIRYQIMFYHNDVHVDRTVSIQESGWAFDSQPTGGNIVPEGSLLLNWKTNFTPERVEIGHKVSSGWPSFNIKFVTDATITANLDSSMTYDVPYSFMGSPSYVVRAYYTSWNYVESDEFSITKTARGFTKQPVGGEIYPGGTLKLKWATNFTPVKVEIGHASVTGTWPNYHEEFVSDKTITTKLGRSMSYDLTYDDFPERFTYLIRAYYSDMYGEYVESSRFTITHTEWKFTVQPIRETIYPWTTYMLEWATNFVPTKIEIGAVYSGSWRSAATITDGLSESMSYPLTYDQVYTSDWTIRAWHGETYISSNEFDIVKAANYYCGRNLLGTFDNETGTLTITGTGPMFDYDITPLEAPWYNISSQIKRVVIGEGVTAIGTYAFCNCINMSQISLTPDIEAVGHSAFLNCTGLRYAAYSGFKSQWDAIDIDGGNTDLLNASVSYLHRSGRLGTTGVYYELIGHDGSLWIYGSGGSTVHVTPPWYDVAQYITELRVDIDTIWEDAFRDCTEVKKVYLSDSLTLVDDGAFNDCTRLTDIYYDSTADDWASIEILGHNAPLLNATLHTAPHVGQLTGDLSWSVNDEGLLRIWLDDDLMGDGEDTDIPDYANYTDTPWYADFKDVITSLRIESGVTSIGKNAFRALPHLRTITIADTVTGIGNIAFAGCVLLEDFTLPNSIETIGANAFMNCDYLELIHLPDSITFLGVGAFRDCGNLEKVWLPDQLTTILANTFMDCPLLDHIDIPATVTAINANAFLNCIELASSTGHVYYGGPSAQWKQITIGTGNTQLLNCPNIHMTPEELRIDAAHFPDAEFRGCVSTNFDADHSGWLTDEEIANVLTIHCGAIDAEALAGIEYFTELKELDCQDNPLQELDLSANTKLQKLVCSDNALTELSLSALPDLYYLNCAGNQLTALDVSHQNLEALYCGDNQLTVLDLSGQALGLLDCRNNPLTQLNLSGQTQLEILSCYGTNLAMLDLRGCTQLLNAVQYGTKTSTADYVQYQYVDNKLERILRLRVDADTELIIPGMIAVDAAHFPDAAFRLWVSDIADSNGSGWLSVAEIDVISEIYLNTAVYADLASTQGIGYFAGITELIIEHTPNLKSLDLSANTQINSLELIDTGLASLTLGDQPQLVSLRCYGNSLTTLDISCCPQLVLAYHGDLDPSHPEYDRYTSGDENELYVSKGIHIEAGDPAPTFTLPASLTSIEAEAFSGIAAEAVLIPAGVTSITGDPFAGNSVRYIYGTTDLVRNFAQAYGYVFVPVRD